MKEFYTIKELAALLAVTDQTIFRLIKRGALPYYKIGHSTRFRRDDVEAFLQSCRINGAPRSAAELSDSL